MSLNRLVQDRDVEGLSYALPVDADPNKYEAGETPLYVAAKLNYVPEATLLLERRADPRYGNRQEAPLHVAARFDHAAVAQLLLSKGASADQRNQHGETPLHVAAKSDATDVARILLAAGAHPNSPDEHDRTPLHAACTSGDADLAQLLLEHGADPNQPDRRGGTPFHDACAAQDPDLVKVFLEFRANSNHTTPYGVSPLQLACGLPLDCWSEAQSLDRQPAGDSHLVAKMLLAAQANPNHRDRAGRTPLHAASGSGNVDLVRLLIEHGADPLVCDLHGNTPLSSASEAQRADAVTLLINEGANPQARNSTGQTPLHLACSTFGSQCMAVEALLAGGADPLSADNNGLTAFHLAARFGRADLLQTMGARIEQPIAPAALEAILEESVRAAATTAIECILELGARGDQLPVADRTLVHGAIASGVIRLVRSLAARGAQIRDALSIPVRSGDTEMVRALVALGADLNIPAIEQNDNDDDAEVAEDTLVEDDDDDAEVAEDTLVEDDDEDREEGEGAFVENYDEGMTLEQRDYANECMTVGSFTLFDIAIEQRDRKMVRTLIELGLRPNPLLDEPLVRLDLDAAQARLDEWESACTEVYSDEYVYPLHTAARNGWVEVLRILIGQGRNVDQYAENDGDEWTALHFVAAECIPVGTACILLERGADVDALTGSEKTPLHLAAERDAVDMARVLLDNGADPNAIAWVGTPLDAAEAHRAHRVARLLRHRGARHAER